MDDGWPTPANEALHEEAEALAPAPVYRRRRTHPIVPFTVSLGVLTAVAGFATWRVGPTDASTAKSSATVAASTVVTVPAVPITTATTIATTTVALATTPAPTTPAPTTTAKPAPALPVATGLKPYPPNGVYDVGRPPMFVMISFDGAADQKLLERWMNAGTTAQARFTFFLSMVYLLGDEHKDHYQGPRHGPGESSIGFARNGDQPASTWLTTIIGGLQKAQRDGYELAMHFGGHWCGPAGVNSWSTEDWSAELDAVQAIAQNADAWNGLSPAQGNVFLAKPSGARTPCLEGKAVTYSPALKERGYRYDASRTRLLREWPIFANDLWSYGFPGVPIRGYPKDIITVDYSIQANLVPGGGALPDARVPQVTSAVYDGLMYGFEQVYYGNRAPFEVANHFTELGKGAYNDAVEKFAVAVCRKPEVHCVTYKEVTDWLDTHADKLGSLQNGEFVKLAKA